MRRTLKDSILWSALFLISMYLAAAAGINQGDEAWFLQVIRRVAEGERLYGDVFYGAGPLTVYLTVPFIWLLGVEVLVVKGIMAAGYATGLYLGVRVLRTLQISPRLQALFVGLTLLFAPPQAAAPYQTLATTFSIATLDATLAALTSQERRRQVQALVMAGASAGMAFATKQNVGVYLLLAIVGAIGIARHCVILKNERSRQWKPIQACIGGFSIAAGLPFVPVLLQGSFPAFLDYGVLNKATYLKLAGISYLAGVREFFNALQSLVRDFSQPEQVILAFRLSSFLLPPAAGLWGAVTLARSTPERRQRGLVVALFTLVTMLTVFPRADYVHLAFTLPGIMVFSVWVLDEWQRRMSTERIAWLPRWIEWPAQALAAGALLLQLTLPAFRTLQGQSVVSDLPHFRGVLVSRAWRDTTLEERAAMTTLHAFSPVFFLHPLAGFYYLLVDLRNPTPYDFPLATAFGRDGEVRVIRSLEKGEIRAVCWEAWDWNLRPALLEDYVARHFRPLGRVGGCTLYLPGAP